MSTDRSPTAPVDLDTQELHRMGYSQELRRGMGAFSNFAVSFSIISILTGGITTYYLGMDAGGPRAHHPRVDRGRDLRPVRGRLHGRDLLGLSLAVVTLWWFLSARKWFTGPRVQGTPEELAEIERDLTLGQIDDRFL